MTVLEAASNCFAKTLPDAKVPENTNVVTGEEDVLVTSTQEVPPLIEYAQSREASKPCTCTVFTDVKPSPIVPVSDDKLTVKGLLNALRISVICVCKYANSVSN